MIALLLSGVMIAGLLGWLAVHRRSEQRERRSLGLDRPVSHGPDPIPVDRPFDASLCAYCEDPQRFHCPACSRPLCAMHRPWLEHQFCAGCETEWESTAGRRKLVILPVMVLAMGLVAAACGVVIVFLERAGYRSGKLGLAAIIGPIVIAAPVYLGTERFMRRWFRQRGQLPQATARR